jgi:hypothetical protein
MAKTGENVRSKLEQGPLVSIGLAKCKKGYRIIKTLIKEEELKDTKILAEVDDLQEALGLMRIEFGKYMLSIADKIYKGGA